ncbi:allophanate hydrolase [Variovorax sp. RHLX14]|uniref:allophanate hydrolase n=1 Tax=Variovorax sp. RHLX14 TaxID=1259731 RepID=UPI003F466677
MATAWITLIDPPLGLAGTIADRPLEGLRFAVKDNIDVEGLPTTAACPSFASDAEAHAHVVQRLLDAGALLVGKTNMDQFACGLNGTRSPYGAVPNSFDPRYVSGGSSSGSAWTVAVGEVDFALGTDTAGSGRVPAGLNNIVGLKPTKGLISTRGVLPAAQSVDCVSIFARTVELAAKVLAVAMGYDALDPYSRPLSPATAPLPSRLRVGIPSALEFFGDAASADAFAASFAQLDKLGATTVPIDYAPLAKAADLLYDSAMVAERYAAVRPFFDAHEHDVIEPVRGILARGKSYSAADLVDAQIHLRALAQKIAPMWDDIDILVVPTAPAHYTIEAMRADPVTLNRNLGAYTNFVNLLDYAAISVPTCLRSDGLPFGLTLIGPCGSDFQLAALAQRVHHATGLTQGATGLPLPAPATLPTIVAAPTVEKVKVAVVGAHLSGMPLNSQLTERGAVLLRETQTAAQYRLFALPGTVPPKPGMVRVPAAEGSALIVEIWEMPSTTYGSFVAMIPAPLGIGTLTLADGSTVQGFVCESIALDGAEDITHHGGWRSYIASRRAPAA